MPDRTPLPIGIDNWRSRWLALPRSSSLHRVASITWERADEMIAGEGETVCGLAGRMTMPGMLNRMEAHRCTRCCDALGIPRGFGAPRNALTGEAADA